MEASGMEKLIDTLKPMKEKLGFWCIDGDTETSRMLKNSQLIESNKIVEDPAHLQKNEKKRGNLDTQHFELARNWIFKMAHLFKKKQLTEKKVENFLLRVQMGNFHLFHVRCNEFDCSCSPIKMFSKWMELDEEKKTIPLEFPATVFASLPSLSFA